MNRMRDRDSHQHEHRRATLPIQRHTGPTCKTERGKQHSQQNGHDREHSKN